MHVLLKHFENPTTKTVLALFLAVSTLSLPAKSDLRQQLEGQKQEQRNIKACFNARLDESQYLLEDAGWRFSGMRTIGGKLYEIYVEEGDGACNKQWSYTATLGVQRSYRSPKDIRFYRSHGYSNPDPQEVWYLEDSRLCRYYQQVAPEPIEMVKKECWTKKGIRN